MFADDPAIQDGIGLNQLLVQLSGDVTGLITPFDPTIWVGNANIDGPICNIEDAAAYDATRWIITCTDTIVDGDRLSIDSISGPGFGTSLIFTGPQVVGQVVL